MKRIADALRAAGSPPTEVAYVQQFPGGLVRLWGECADPVLMMRLASILSADPKSSVAIAIEGASAVLAYVGEGEPRPAGAIDAARRWLHGRATAKDCEQAGQAAESVGSAYRGVKAKDKVDKRAYRAASYAAFAAAKAALVARDAAVTTELEYDAEYTFEDAWDGARVSCALGAAQALIDAVEAALAATSANATLETGTALAGTAAAEESRPAAMAWAASIVRGHLSAETLRLAEVRSDG